MLSFLLPFLSPGLYTPIHLKNPNKNLLADQIGDKASQNRGFGDNGIFPGDLIPGQMVAISVLSLMTFNVILVMPLLQKISG